MKTQLLKVFGLLLLITFIFSSCEMSQTRNEFSGIADGGKVPASLAIASGDVGIMLECLDSLRNKLPDGGLSDTERGEIALDMIDLLSVLSQVVIKVGPYLVEGVPPANLTEVDDFLESADPGLFGQIAIEELMGYGIHSDPSPLQLFWSLLSLILIQDTYPAVTYLDFDAGPELDLYNLIVNKAVELGAEGTNEQFLPLLDHLRFTVLGE